MLKTNNIIRNGITYTKTYSDAGYYIMRDDVSYEEAIDPLDSGRFYIETDNLIETNIDGNEAEEVLKILMGVDE